MKRKNKKESIHKEIRRIRLACRLSQTAFAAMLGVTQVSVVYWEQGKMSPMATTLLKIMRLAKKLGYDFDIDEALIERQ